MENNLHVETVSGACRDSARNAPHADQTQGLAGYAGTHHVSRAPTGPFPVT